AQWRRLAGGRLPGVGDGGWLCDAAQPASAADPTSARWTESDCESRVLLGRNDLASHHTDQRALYRALSIVGGLYIRLERKESSAAFAHDRHQPRSTRLAGR